MTQPLPQSLISYADYLAAERQAEVRHEYLRGEVYAMAGGTPKHALLATNVARLLGIALSGRACAVYGADLRVRIPTTDLSTYPDITVVCSHFQAAEDDQHAVINPTLLVEVLSDSTEGYDRGDKAAHYRRIPSLKAYLLVSQHKSRLELFTRNGDMWQLSEAGPGEQLSIAPLEVSLEVDAVYADPLAGAAAN